MYVYTYIYTCTCMYVYILYMYSVCVCVGNLRVPDGLEVYEKDLGTEIRCQTLCTMQYAGMKGQ